MSESPRRFYKETSARAEGDAFAVMLDARRLKTPGGAMFGVPTLALAEACAAEWAAQGERIVPSTMPLTQLAFAAIDHPRREDTIAYVSKYAETDLLCHRAATPAPLIARQAEIWDPLLAWAREAFGLELPVVTGVIAAAIDPATLKRLRVIAAELDDFRRTALAQATGLSGSAIIGLALLHDRLNAAQGYAAATLDEAWSVEHWGEDAEARARLVRLRTEFESLARFIAALL